jgi:hypothetical protein
LKKVLTDIGDGERVFLPEPVRVTGAVVADESQPITADMAHQVREQGGRQPFTVRQVGAVLADDSRQGAQVPGALGLLIGCL